jgi:hypothetical protein
MLVRPHVVAVDSVGQVFVGNQDKLGYLSTLVFPSRASSDVAPLYTIMLAGGMSGSPIAGLAIGSNDGLWLGQYNVYHYPAHTRVSDGSISFGPSLAAIATTVAGEVLLASAGGNVTTYSAFDGMADASTTIPIRTLMTGRTIRSIAVVNDTLFVLDSTGAVDEFAANASGSTAPAATIASPMAAPESAHAIAVDASATPPILYVAADGTSLATIYEVPLVGSAPAYTAGSVTSLHGAMTTLTSAESVFVVHY